MTLHLIIRIPHTPRVLSYLLQVAPKALPEENNPKYKKT